MTTTQDTHNAMTQQKHMTTHDTTHGAYAHTHAMRVYSLFDTIAALKSSVLPADSADDRHGLT